MSDSLKCKQLETRCQPDSFADLSYNPDEIPGFSSYIYSENRPREPHEYAGNWRAEQKLAQLYKDIGYSKDVSLEFILEDLKTKLSAMDDLEQDLDSLKDESYEKTNQLRELQSAYSASVSEYENNKAVIISLKDMLSNFGSHRDDCNYLEIICSGRKADEVKSCSCGWINSIKDLGDI